MSAATTIARAWAVMRSDGLCLGFTDHDMALEFEGVAFRPEAGLSAQALAQGLGLSMDNTEVQGVLSSDAITPEDLAAGRWDGAEVRLWEVDWRDVAQRRLLFRGSLGEIAFAGGAYRAELRGLAQALNRPQGRVFHARCSALLGDAQCRLDLSQVGYSVEAVVSSTSEGGARLRLSGMDGHAPGWFEHGRVEFLDGPATGLSGVVKIDRPGAKDAREVELWAAPGATPRAGDRLRMLAGCDKQAATCRGKFLNFLNFRGFPELPPEDWLLAPQVARGRR